jgi:hypothetical protein
MRVYKRHLVIAIGGLAAAILLGILFAPPPPRIMTVNRLAAQVAAICPVSTR